MRKKFFLALDLWSSLRLIVIRPSTTIRDSFCFYRTEILDTTKRREIELSDVEQQLEIYRRLGKDFEVIATEYSNVKSDLERQNWTLNEIKKKLNQSV